MSADDCIRFFVLTLGRSGSSLLCAVLADAGADFGVPAPATWDPDDGVLEHPLIVAAAHDYRRAYDALAGAFTCSPRLEAKWRRWRGRRRLQRALAAARYLKIGDLDLLVQPAFKLGYEPRLILSYRRFEPAMASLVTGRTHDGPEALARDYLRLYGQGLMLLHAFGGCVVGYDDLVGGSDPTLAALAAVTGLDRTRLQAAAAARIRPAVAGHEALGVHAATDALHRQLEAARGVVFEPAAPVRRKRERRG